MPIPAPTLNIDFFEISPIPILVFSAEWEIIKYNTTAKGIAEDCNQLAKEGVALSTLIPTDWRELNTFEITLNAQSYKITSTIAQDLFIFYFTPLNRLEKIIFQQRYYEQILEGLTSGVVLIDVDQKIQYMNNSMEKLLECSREELLGKKATMLAGNKDDADLVANKMKDRKEGKSEVYTKETNIKGKRKYIEIQGLPFKNTHGKILGSIAVMNDVTDRKQTEKSLNHLSMFAQKTTNGIIITTADGRIEWVNSSFEQITGYAFDEIIGLKPGQFLQGNDTEKKTINHFRNQLKTQKPFEIEIKNYRKNKESFWAHMSITPMFNAAGVLVNYMAIISDNTEKMEMMRNLSENENKYRELVETSSNFIYQADYLGNFTFFNEVGISKLGYEKDEMIGMNFTHLVDPEWQQNVIEFYKNQFEKKEKESYHKFPVITKQGKKIWIEQNVQMYAVNGWITGFQSYARDVTERKILEDELEQQKKLLNTILDSLPLVVFLKQKNGAYKFINKATENKLGQSDGMDRLTFLKHFDYSDNQVWNDRSPFESEEKIIYLGKQKYYIVGKEIIHPESLDQPLLLGYAFDITDRKRIEGDLRKAKLKAEKSTAAKEKFISIMSHEIRTPMNAVVGINNLLLQQDHLPEQKEYFQATKTASENLLKILNNVLDLSKLDAGKVVIENKNLDLRKLIDEVISTFKFKAAEKNIQLIAEIDAELPPIIKGDALKLHQIMVNLVSNALKFTHEGQVIVKVEIVEEINQKLFLRFTVSDTGIGIPAEKLYLIFESFTQVSSKIAQQYGGTGLGLTITKSLIELQGGDIEVESTEGVGTKFFFQLSFDPSDTVVSTEKENTEYNLEGVKILVVDDNAMNQMIVQKFLEKKNIELKFANHGKEAIEILLQHPIDLILMDLQMPVMDGYEAVKYIRKKLKISVNDLPIVAMTAAAGSDEMTKLSKYEFNGLISKPFDPENLYGIIARNLGHVTREIAMPQEAKKTEQISPINLTYLKQSSGGSNEFVKNMIQIFLTQTPNYLEEIKIFYKTQNWGKLQSIVHKMKPTMTMMGMSLKNQMDTLEEMAKQKKDLDLMGPMLETVYSQCALAFEDLGKELEMLK